VTALPVNRGLSLVAYWTARSESTHTDLMVTGEVDAIT